MEKLEKEIEEWRTFLVEDILKIVKRELKEDVEILMERLKDKGIIKEQ